MTYQHGPLQVKHWRWYTQSDTEQSSVAFTDFHNGVETLSFDGPWGLFKLLHATQLKPGPTPGHYIWIVKLKKHEAIFDLTTGENHSLFDLRLFKNFHLPNSLYPS